MMAGHALAATAVLLMAAGGVATATAGSAIAASAEGSAIAASAPAVTTADRQPDGRSLVEAALHRYALPPFVYEELALVISDAQGRFSLRTLQHHLTRGAHQLVVVTPADLRGTRLPLGSAAAATGGDSPLFGSDFLLADLLPEQPAGQDYQRVDLQYIDRLPHHVVAARPSAGAGGGDERRLYLRQDNLFLSRIDYLDAHGELLRRQSFRDPRPDERGIWRPGMILMEDLRKHHRSLLKVERRIHAQEAITP